MYKKIAGLAGAITALVVPQAAKAMPATPANDVLNIGSYAELLDPVPNALAVLRSVDQAPTKPARVEKAQYYDYHHHHHHHHHHNGYGWGWGGWGPPSPYYYHHHHHHHHNYYYQGE